MAAEYGKGVYCPSPVEVVKSGIEPVRYLDRFPPESCWFQMIQEASFEDDSP